VRHKANRLIQATDMRAGLGSSARLNAIDRASAAALAQGWRLREVLRGGGIHDGP